MYIAIVIKKTDDTTICISGISQPIVLDEGDNAVRVRIPIDLLEEDAYRLHLELISIDEYGKSYTYDNPFISFPFKVTKTEDRYIWPTKYYGNVREKGITAEILR